MNNQNMMQQKVSPEYAGLLVRSVTPTVVGEINKVKGSLIKAEIQMSVAEIKAAMAAAGLIALGGMITAVGSIVGGTIALGSCGAMLKNQASQKISEKSIGKEIAKETKKLNGAENALKEVKDGQPEAEKILQNNEEVTQGAPKDEFTEKDIEKIKNTIAELKEKKSRVLSDAQMENNLASTYAQSAKGFSDAPAEAGKSMTESVKKQQEANEQQSQANYRALQSGDGALDKTIDSVLKANYMPPLMRRG